MLCRIPGVLGMCTVLGLCGLARMLSRFARMFLGFGGFARMLRGATGMLSGGCRGLLLVGGLATVFVSESNEREREDKAGEKFHDGDSSVDRNAKEHNATGRPAPPPRLTAEGLLIAHR